MQYDLSRALPLMVANYAKRFNIDVRLQGTEARTNGRKIYIPRLDLHDNVSARYAYAYLAHEAGHVRYSNFKVVKKAHNDPTLFIIFNVLEDSRIEYRISREFIGVYENLEFLRHKFDAEFNDFAMNIDRMPLCFIFTTFLIVYGEVVNQGFKSFRSKAAFMIKQMRKFMQASTLQEIKSIVAKVKHAKNSSQVLKLATRLKEILADEQFKQDAIEQHYKDKHIKHKGDKGMVLVFNAGKKFSLIEEFEGIQRAESECSFERITPYEEPATTINKLYDVNSSVREDFGRVEVKKAKPGSVDYLAVEGHRFKTLGRILKHKITANIESKRVSNTNGLSLNLKKAILMDAGETRIFNRKDHYEDYKTQIHILIDVSGSMLSRDDGRNTRAEIACSSALNMALALEGICGVETICHSFPGRDCEIDAILLPHELASKEASYFDQKPHGSTPLAQALWHIYGECINSDCVRKMVIIFTDGVPDSIDQTRNIIRKCETEGIELYAFGIRVDMVNELFEHSRIINDVNELPDLSMNLLSRLFDY